MVDSPDDSAALPAVSPDDPCGPDLELVGDPGFMNFFAATEGRLPSTSYYAFKRESIDFPAALQTAEKLLQRSHDLRLLVLLAKLAALNRDLPGFAHWLAVIAWLVANQWDDAHPRADQDDYAARLWQLATLNDGPVVVLPLQYVPLAETPRDGAVTFRAHLVAVGEVKPRVETRVNAFGEAETGVEETIASASAIDRILKAVDLDKLVATFKTLQGIRVAMESIVAATASHVGFEQAPRFDALAPLVERMTNFLQGALARRDPSMAPPPEAPHAGDAAAESATPPVAFATLTDVDAALASALGYFAASEPSSPALLLIGQARETLGKNLFHVMKLLAPAHADAARVFVGPDGAFTVPISGLLEAPSAEFARADAPPAPSRAAALALIDGVASHMRRVEPSSPAPYLLDRARALAPRDFLSLLQEVLPEDDLSAMKSGH
jgi:type VI secretion system protein ImpA